MPKVTQLVVAQEQSQDLRTNGIVFLCECSSKVSGNRRVCVWTGTCSAPGDLRCSGGPVVLRDKFFVHREEPGFSPTCPAWSLGCSHSYCAMSAEKGFVSFYTLTVDVQPEGRAEAAPPLTRSSLTAPRTRCGSFCGWASWVLREGACENVALCSLPSPEPSAPDPAGLPFPGHGVHL